MTRKNFWPGFAAGVAAGALAGIGGVLAFKRGSRKADHRVVRLEKSVNVGRPVQAVFAAWSNFERLPQSISFVKRVQRFGTQSRWLVNIDGRGFEWDAQITQVAPNESIGWKSLSGPKHTGRISFSPLGDQTVVHVLMNYAPPLGALGSAFPMDSHLEQWIERGLRDFKSAMEREAGQRTGTTGGRLAREETSLSSSTGPVGTPGKPAAPGMVRYTRPPEAKY
ncbi:MAG TPA: SRPBCC family protein [Terriglobales bacterium]|nr:SRPBCC family protein [Terriglobales bacterium]